MKMNDALKFKCILFWHLNCAKGDSMVINENFQTFRLLIILNEVCSKSLVDNWRGKKCKKVKKRVKTVCPQVWWSHNIHYGAQTLKEKQKRKKIKGEKCLLPNRR